MVAVEIPEQIVPDTREEPSWPLKLFAASPLKQEKWGALEDVLESIAGSTEKAVEGRECLDIGADNGVLSILLRQLGGRWSSCDLSSVTVESIRTLVHDRVFQIDGKSTPFSAGQFDLVVIIDLLEHIETDREFVNELYRITKPGADIIVNVPNPKEGMLRKIRFLLGQTDEKHGHVRPGYTPEELTELFGDNFTLLTHRSYSRFFSVVADTAITAAIEFLQALGGGKIRSSSKRSTGMPKSEVSKGTLITASEIRKYEKLFRVYRFVAPFLRALVKLDHFFPWLHGNVYVAAFRRTEKACTPTLESEQYDGLDPLE
ncbi:MAG: class I SAM-dependent methyltransferase [Bdellovibrionales bacterium]|nr:class I SAM-dependent methyltransferase [Bdellovibrionales bacterium]